MNQYTIHCGGFSIELGKKTAIMGILNVTPDSFSDGGKYLNHDAAVAHAEKMILDGVDIIDIGGESSRPFSKSITLEEETQRVVPVILHLSKRIGVPISVDTRKAEVAKRAIDAGASIVNDISSLRHDPDMSSVVAKYGVPVILMHMQGSPETMQEKPVYKNPVNDIKQFLKESIDLAEKNGIHRKNIIIDPGIGFGKTMDDNLILINNLKEFITLEAPILIGTSRKAFIRNILKDSIKKDFRNEDLHVVEVGTQASVAASVLNGAHIVRVHDVLSTHTTVKVIEAIRNVDNVRV